MCLTAIIGWCSREKMSLPPTNKWTASNWLAFFVSRVLLPLLLCMNHTSDDRMCCPSLEWRVGPARVPSIVYRNDNLRLEIHRLLPFFSSFVFSVHKCLMSLVHCAIIFFFFLFVCFSGRAHALLSLFTTVKYNDQTAGSHDKPNDDEFFLTLSLSLERVCLFRWRRSHRILLLYLVYSDAANKYTLYSIFSNVAC